MSKNSSSAQRQVLLADFLLWMKNLNTPITIIAIAFALGLPLGIALLGHPDFGGAAGKSILGTIDLRFPFWLFITQFVFALILLTDLWKDLWNYLKELTTQRHFLGFVVLMSIIVTIASGYWIEGRHRVQSDESIFLSTAQNLFSNQISGACDEGEFGENGLECTKSANNFKARGLAAVYTFFMPILGSSLQWIFAFHLVLFAITGVLFYLAILAWTKHPMLAVVTSLALLVQPTVMFQFRSASVEPLYVFLSGAVLLLLHWAYQRDTVRHWVLVALMMAFFAQTRQETAFCFAAFLAVAIPKLLSSKDFRFPAFISALSFFSLPVLVTISFYQGYGFQGGEFEAHGNFLKHIGINWDVMTKSDIGRDGLLANPFLTSLTLLAAAGAFTLLMQALFSPVARKQLGFLLLYHIQTYMIFENVSGDFTIEINQRYSLVIFPTMAFLTALFLEWVFIQGIPKALGTTNQNKATGTYNKTLWLSIIISSILLIGLSFRHSDSYQANIMYRNNHLTTEEYQILQWLRAQPEKPRLFIYARPWHFIGYGYSAWHYDRLRNNPQELAKVLQKYQGEVYYVRGMDCWNRETWHKKAVEHRITTTCDDFESRFEITPAYQTIITNNFPLTINKVNSIKDYETDKLATIGIFNDLPDQDIALVSWRLADLQKPWTYQLILNDSIWREGPFETKALMDTLVHPNIQPGYNRVVLRVLDQNGSIITEKQQSSFFPRGKALPLIRIKPTQSFQSWGNMLANRSVNENILTVAGVKYNEGFGTHAYSQISFQLNGKFQSFHTKVGLDDEEQGGDGVQFRVVGDGKILWQSRQIKASQLETAQIDVRGIQTLELIADSLSEKNFDHADWLEPFLVGESP